MDCRPSRTATSRRSITTGSTGSRPRCLRCPSSSTAASRRLAEAQTSPRSCRRRDARARGLSGAVAFAAVDPDLFGEPAPHATMKQVLAAMIPYIERELARGTRLHAITRHFVGAFHGVPGARAFRRHLAEHGVKPAAGVDVLRGRSRWSRPRSARRVMPESHTRSCSSLRPPRRGCGRTVAARANPHLVRSALRAPSARSTHDACTARNRR